MRKSIKNKWVKALRSGKYKQGTGQLHSENEEGKSFCCLGVLATIVDPYQKTWEPTNGYFADEESPGEWESPRHAVQARLLGKGGLGVGVAKKLGKFNDKGKSFKWIASYIERYL
jgi:hypothetical protein